jgi:hypothetical protein
MRQTKSDQIYSYHIKCIAREHKLLVPALSVAYSQLLCGQTVTAYICNDEYSGGYISGAVLTQLIHLITVYSWVLNG